MFLNFPEVEVGCKEKYGSARQECMGLFSVGLFALDFGFFDGSSDDARKRESQGGEKAAGRDSAVCVCYQSKF